MMYACPNCRQHRAGPDKMVLRRWLNHAGHSGDHGRCGYCSSALVELKCSCGEELPGPGEDYCRCCGVDVSYIQDSYPLIYGQVNTGSQINSQIYGVGQIPWPPLQSGSIVGSGAIYTGQTSGTTVTVSPVTGFYTGIQGDFVSMSGSSLDVPIAEDKVEEKSIEEKLLVKEMVWELDEHLEREV